MDNQKLRPLGDGVLVRLAAAEDTSKGGIIIPDAAKEKPRRGEVLAVGPGRVADPCNGTVPVGVKPGEVVLFDRYAGTAFGDDLLLLKESDLVAVVES